MDQADGPADGPGDGPGQGSGVGKRSRTKCTKIRALKGTATVDFDETGAPIGEHASHFASLYAMVVKDTISCTYQSWKAVPKEEKEDCWQQMKDYFNITVEKEVAKKKTIKMMGERWKNWKADLVKNFIRRENPKNPCDEWTIDEDEWETFKRQKQTDEWLEASQRGKLSAQKPKIPHRMGSCGYRGAQLKWKDTDHIKLPSWPSGMQILDVRSQRWVKARCVTNEEGVYVPKDKNTEEVVERLCTLTSQPPEQRLPPCEILTNALGTPEHPGRVRGYSGYVGKKQVYRKSKRRGTSHANWSQEAFDMAVKQIEEKAMQRVDERVGQQIQAFMAQMWWAGGNQQGFGNQQGVILQESPRESQPHTHVASNDDLPQVPFHDYQGIVNCGLYLLDNTQTRRKAAEGQLHPATANATVHHRPLGPDQARVSIDRVEDEYREWSVHFPLEDGTDRLGELINSFLILPTYLVEILEKDDTPTKPPQKAKVQQIENKATSATSIVERAELLPSELVQRLSDSGILLYQFLMVQPADFTKLTVPYSEDQFFRSGELIVNVPDIIEILKQDRANISMLKLFSMCCKQLCDEIDTAESRHVHFLDPEICAATNLKVHLPGVTLYLKEVFDKVEVSPSIMVLPYHEGAHWVLLIVDDASWRRIKLAGLISIQPFFGGEERTESEIRLEVAPLVSIERTDWMWKAFLPEGGDRNHEASHIFLPAIELGDAFPPVMVVIGGYDPLQDWQRRYSEMLKQKGKDVQVIDYPSAVHAFYVLPFGESKQLVGDTMKFVEAKRCKTV